MQNNSVDNKDIICPSTKCLGDLFSGDRHYEIPGYQRPYEWGKKQLKELCDSIWRGFENKQLLLLGTIQFNCIKTDDGNEIYEIIDGQQRMTTLWLLLSVLLECKDKDNNICFNHTNNSNGEYINDLNNVRNSDYKPQNANYRNNYIELEKFINKQKDLNISEFKNYLLNSVIFVEIITVFSQDNSIERILQIFDALNTAGLPLDKKDVFKIRFFDYLKRQSQNASDKSESDQMQTISEAYNIIESTGKLGEAYALNEDNLIQAFRFWIISHSKKDVSANVMKESYTAFFERFFSGNMADDDTLSNCSEYITAEHFLEIAKMMKKTQEIINKIDKGNSAGSAEDKLLCCAREMLSECGYSRIADLPFALVYTVGKSSDKLSEQEVRNVWKLTEMMWKYCLLLYAGAGQILNEAFFNIGNYVLCKIGNGDENINSLKSHLNGMIQKWLKNSNHYKSDTIITALSPKGNIFKMKKEYLFISMSYIDDCEGVSSREIKEQIFYKMDKKHWHQIEHIASFSLNENKPYCNAIGNLMHLEHNINESLGAATGKKTIKSIEDDINLKCQKNDSQKNYWNSVLPCVKKFLESVEGKINEQQLEDMINSRSNVKLSFIAKQFVPFDSKFAEFINPELQNDQN